MITLFLLCDSVENRNIIKGFSFSQLKQFKYAIRHQLMRSCLANLNELEAPCCSHSSSSSISATSVTEALDLVNGKLIKNPAKQPVGISEGSVVAFYFSAYWVRC